MPRQNTKLGLANEQKVKVLAAHPEDLSFTSGTYMIAEEN